jgi:hypothetical protein
MKRALRITGWVYVTGVILMMTALLFGYYKHGIGIPTKVLPYHLAVSFLWPVAVLIVVLNAFGHFPIE